MTFSRIEQVFPDAKPIVQRAPKGPTAELTISAADTAALKEPYAFGFEGAEPGSDLEEKLLTVWENTATGRIDKDLNTLANAERDAGHLYGAGADGREAAEVAIHT